MSNNKFKIKSEWILPILAEFGRYCRDNNQIRVSRIVIDLMRAIQEDFKDAR